MVQLGRLHRLPVLILLSAGLGAGAVACSGSGPGGASNGVASIKSGDHNTTATTAKPGSGPTDPEDAALAYARCMRDHGIDMPDPDTSAGPGVVRFSAGPGGGLDAGKTKVEDADKACHDLLGNAAPQNVDPKQAKEMQDQALAFSRCMREHGVDMPDPTFGSNGQMTMKIDPSSGIDPSDPRFQAAQQACGSAFGPAGAKIGAAVSGGSAGGGAPGAKGGMVFATGGGQGSASSGGGK